MAFNKLTQEEKEVIENKGTEKPFTGEYDNFYEDGVFICRKCNNPLFSSKAKFDAGCGWPAFDESFPNTINRLPDPDGSRVEIECANCGAHLGHEFTGEHLTNKNLRECVNSLSICFIPKDAEMPKVFCNPGSWNQQRNFSKNERVGRKPLERFLVTFKGRFWLNLQ